MQADARGSFQNIITISKLQPDALVRELISRYSVTIPEQISNTDDLKEAGVLLGRLANTVSSPISKLPRDRKKQKAAMPVMKQSAWQ